MSDGTASARSSSPLDRDPAFRVITVTKETGLGLKILGGINRNEGPLVYIHEVIPGGDCYKDGRLKPGDQLVSINKESMIGVSFEEAKSIITRAKLRSESPWEIAFIRQKSYCGHPGNICCPSPQVSELKAQLADYSDQNKESVQDLRKRVTVLDCQLRKSEMARKAFKASTERLLGFIEAIQEVLLDSSAPLSTLSERRAVLASQTSLPLLARNGRSFPATLLLESKELVRSVRAILDMDCLPYGWEEAYTADGIKYFINHVTQTTSWIHPVMSALNLSCAEESEEDCPRELTDPKS